MFELDIYNNFGVGTDVLNTGPCPLERWALIGYKSSAETTICSASVVEVEGGPDRRERLARRAKIIRRQTVAVVGRSGIMDDVEGVGDGEEVRSANHARGNSRAELLNLTANVPQEGIATPSAYQHDCVDGDLVEVHRHGCSAPQGVGANLFRRETEAILAHCRRCGAELGSDEVGPNEDNLLIETERIYRRLIGRSGIAPNPLGTGPSSCMCCVKASSLSMLRRSAIIVLYYY